MSNPITSGSESILRACAKLEWLGPLVMRLGFGYFWLETGWAKLHNLDGATQRFVEWGLPAPAFTAPFSAGAEFIGGALLIAGLLTRFTSVALLINMLVALATVAIKNASGVDEFFELDEVVYIMIFFWLMLAGPGRVSVDTWLVRALGIRTAGTIWPAPHATAAPARG